MFFETRAFCAPRDAERPEDNQDAFETDAQRGIAAVADGASSGLFSGPWAEIITRATVNNTPNLSDRDSFRSWLAEQRHCWKDTVNLSALNFFQRGKLREYGPGATTLVWAELQRRNNDHVDEAGESQGYLLRCFAIGDSCFLHIRDGTLLRTFPIQHSEELERDPLTIGSLDRNNDDLLEFQTFEDLCQPGDLILMCTDAFAGWLLRQQESGSTPNWESFWSMNNDEWSQLIQGLRDSRPPEIRVDDTTLVMLRVLPPHEERRPRTTIRGLFWLKMMFPSQEVPSSRCGFARRLGDWSSSLHGSRNTCCAPYGP